MKKLLIPAMALFLFVGNVNASTSFENTTAVEKKDGEKDALKKKNKDLKKERKLLKEETQKMNVALANKRIEEQNAKTKRKIAKKQIELNK